MTWYFAGRIGAVRGTPSLACFPWRVELHSFSFGATQNNPGSALRGYVQPRTRNNTINIGMGMPNNHRSAHPIAPLSSFLILASMFLIIPPN